MYAMARRMGSGMVSDRKNMEKGFLPALFRDAERTEEGAL